MLVFSRRVDQWLSVGSDILVGPTDIDDRTARVLAKGRMIGGAEDGGTFQSAHELSPGQSFSIGSMIVVTLLEVGPDSVRLGINAPPHLRVSSKDKRQASRDQSGEAE
jgi:sRNA-binding carbon storage regulator CsrA